MNLFDYRNGILHAEDVDMNIVAEEVGTPCYVYSQAAILKRFRKVREVFAEVSPLICFAMKANSSLAVLDLLCKEGGGFDVVSGGELFRALKVGCDPKKIVFAGVAKTQAEIREAVDAGILLFDVESEQELIAIDKIARAAGKRAAVALRINPNVDANTHAKITTGKAESKFGIDKHTALALYLRSHEFEAVDLVGLHMHIGSQITEVEPYVKALEVDLQFIETCRSKGINIEYLDIGGGFGINYRRQEAQPLDSFAKAMLPLLKQSKCKIIMEPGRFIAGNAGIMLTRVVYVKKTPVKTFVIVDSAMNDLMRPMLYDAFHHVAPVVLPSGCVDPRDQAENDSLEVVDVVGGVCESTDVLAKARPFPPVKQGDLLAVFSAGAYGSAMSSTYNSRPLAAEILVDESSYRIIRDRQSYEDLVARERI